MANRVVIWPVGKETAARAYATWTDEQFALIAPEQGMFSYVYTDIFDQWVTPYLGPPFAYPVGTEIAEPVGGEGMRADGVLADSYTPPDQA